MVYRGETKLGMIQKGKWEDVTAQQLTSNFEKSWLKKIFTQTKRTESRERNTNVAKGCQGKRGRDEYG